jgi:hypothetical protein
MARASWLKDVLEDLRSQGVPVHYVGGWDTRGSTTFDPRGIICHDTGGSPNSTDAGEISVLLNGSTSAPPPIAQIYLSRTTGVHLVATGRCNHARTGQAGPLKGLGNTNLVGIEAAANIGRSWPPAQYRWYVQLVTAICRHRGWNPYQHIAAHREHQPGEKLDPQGIGMPQFRADVQTALRGESTPTPQGDDMPLLFFAKLAGDPTVRLCESYMTNRFVSATEFPVLKQALIANSLGATVWEWPNDAAHRALFGVNLDPIDDDPEPLLVTLSPQQLTDLGVQIRQGVPSLDQIRVVVDAELDEQSRAGADSDSA